MDNTVIAKLTYKDDKAACAYANRIIEESKMSNQWFPYMNEIANLLDHPKSLVRNRALTILANLLKWDEKNIFKKILPSYLSHIQDEKPITVRICIQSLAIIGTTKPQYQKEILNKLENIDLSKYKDSMAPLIQKDILETRRVLQKEANDE